MNEEKQVLRIGIDGRWEAAEFAAAFSAFDRLYSLCLGLAIQMDDLAAVEQFYPDHLVFNRSISNNYLYRRGRLLNRLNFQADRTLLVTGSRISDQLSELLEPEERLQVLRVSYGSPGSGDFSGLGAIIGHLKDFLIYLIDILRDRPQRRLDNDHRALENEKLKQEIEGLKIENAKKLVALGQDLGYTRLQQRQMVAAVVHEQKPLVRLITDGKITSASSGDESLS
jgi:hypothetical protein